MECEEAVAAAKDWLATANSALEQAALASAQLESDLIRLDTEISSGTQAQPDSISSASVALTKLLDDLKNAGSVPASMLSEAEAQMAILMTGFGRIAEFARTQEHNSGAAAGQAGDDGGPEGEEVKRRRLTGKQPIDSPAAIVPDVGFTEMEQSSEERPPPH